MKRILVHRKTALERRITQVAKEASGVFRSRYGVWFLAMISFVESALVVPIITDPFLAAYIIANRAKAIRAVWVTTLASVLGGAVAYATAAFVIDIILSNFFPSLSSTELQNMARQFETGTFLVTLLGAITPIPYTVVALAAGSVQANFIVFVIASALGRGARYGLVAFLTLRFGERAVAEMQKRVWLSTVVVCALIALYFYYKLS